MKAAEPGLCGKVPLSGQGPHHIGQTPAAVVGHLLLGSLRRNQHCGRGRGAANGLQFSLSDCEKRLVTNTVLHALSKNCRLDSAGGTSLRGRGESFGKPVLQTPALAKHANLWW